MAKRRKKKKKTQKRLTGFILGAAFLIVAFFILFVAVVKAGWFGKLPTKDELQSIQNQTATLVYSSDEVLLGKYFSQNRTKIDWNDIPQHLVNALVATEDARFFTHEGIDSKSYMRVLIKTIILGDESSGGGSTITQQLVKNLYGRTNYAIMTLPVNKVKEAIIAQRMEEAYSKREILLLYFNTVPFGENVYGIEAAANRYFNKNTSELTIPEAATLVGMLKANTYYNPRLHPEHAKKRRNLVLNLMNKQGYLSNKEKERFQAEPMDLNYANYSLKGPANYFLYQVKQRALDIIKTYNRENQTGYDLETDGLTIRTTLNARIQDLVKASIKKHLSTMQRHLDRQLTGQKEQYVAEVKKDKVEKREIFSWDGVKVREMTKSDSLWHYKKMLNASALMADPNTGNVKVWIGGNHYRYLPYDLVRARRAAASAFKPVLYAAALGEGFGPCTYLSNEEKIYKKFDGWKPANYDRSSGGEVAMWYALAHSMNIPTVDLYFKTGHEALDYTYRKLGFDTPLPEKPSMALGAKEVSLAELVRAYSAFSNNGFLPELKIIEKILDQNGKVLYRAKKENAKALSGKQTEKITAILSRAAREGTGASLYNTYGVDAGLVAKTGTSQDYKDARFMCYNRNMVLGIWVGARDPEIHFNSGTYGSGAALALPIAGRTINKMERNGSLASRYLGPLNLSVDTASLMNCKPRREIKDSKDGFIKEAIDGIKNLFKGKDKKDKPGEAVQPDSSEKEKKKSGSKVKRFFKKIFGKKKDKN